MVEVSGNVTAPRSVGGRALSLARPANFSMASLKRQKLTAESIVRKAHGATTRTGCCQALGRSVSVTGSNAGAARRQVRIRIGRCPYRARAAIEISGDVTRRSSPLAYTGEALSLPSAAKLNG